MFSFLDLGSRDFERRQLSRIEAKMNLILDHLGIDCQDPNDPRNLSEEVRGLADAGRKIEAVKAHRRQTGVGLREAKDAVEAYRR